MAKIDSTNVEFVNDMFDNTEGETATLTDTRLTYTGATTRYFHVALSFSYTPATNFDLYVFGVARNGTVEDSSKIFISSSITSDHASSALHVLLKLDQNDYLEFFVGNTFVGGSSIQIKSMNFVAIGM